MSQALLPIYELEKALLAPFMAMTSRGLRINEALRQERITILAEEEGRLNVEASAIVLPLREKLKQPKLQWVKHTCKGCRNGKKKRLTCEACKGVGQWEEHEFNLGSAHQLKDVLYAAMKLPTRLRDKKPSVDEEALQSLLSMDKSGLVAKALRYAKLSTMREIYERLEPASDGRVRTVLNPAGTATGRANSRSAFYVPNSTNLLNLPSFEARRDALYRVRDVVVPSEGYVFLYADLSQAEARVTACLSRDDELFRRWSTPGWDVHIWTAASLGSKAESDVSPVEREANGKMPRHALNYGMGPDKYWREVNSKADLTGIAISKGEAAKVHLGYHRLHPNLKKWWREVEGKLLAGEPLRTCYGREGRYWPRVLDGRPDSDSLQAAIAWEPQSTVADLLDYGLLDIWKQEDSRYRLVLQVYDAVLVEAKEESYLEVAQLLRRSLERKMVIRGYELTIPADVKLCRKSWADEEKLKLC